MLTVNCYKVIPNPSLQRTCTYAIFVALQVYPPHSGNNMNKETEMFVASKELDLAQKEYRESLINLVDKINDLVESTQIKATKLDSSCQKVIDLLKKYE